MDTRPGFYRKFGTLPRTIFNEVRIDIAAQGDIIDLSVLHDIFT